MFDTINKIFLKIFNVFLIIILAFFILYTYTFTIVYADIDIIFFVVALVFLYIYIFGNYIIIVAIFKKFEKTYFYNILLGPIIPTLFYLLRIIQDKNIFILNNNDLFYLLLLYTGFFVITYFYIDFISRYFIPIIVGKYIHDPIGEDFAFISIYSKYDYSYSGDIFLFIEDIITNMLKYDQSDMKIIYHDKIPYKIFRYTRKNYHRTRPFLEHILLVRMKCIDTNYIEWLDKSEIHEEQPQQNLDVASINQNLILEIENDIELAEQTVHNCFFINQYYESGDSISHKSSLASDTFLAFNNILSKNVKIVCHTEDDILSSNLFKLRYNLFLQYYNKTYGTILEKFKLIFDKMFNKAMKQFIIIILVLIGIFYSIFLIYQKMSLDFFQLITIILMLPTAIYSIIWTYDWFKKKRE